MHIISSLQIQEIVFLSNSNTLLFLLSFLPLYIYIYVLRVLMLLQSQTVLLASQINRAIAATKFAPCFRSNKFKSSFAAACASALVSLLQQKTFAVQQWVTHFQLQKC